jgi:hypothetical protein
MVVKPLFTLENATFWSFWLRAGLAPQPFIIWVWNIGSCVLSSSRATKWPPYELILSISKFPYKRYIRLYGVHTVIYGIYTVYGNPIYGLGQPYICDVYWYMIRGTYSYLLLPSLKQVRPPAQPQTAGWSAQRPPLLVSGNTALLVNGLKLHRTAIPCQKRHGCPQSTHPLHEARACGCADIT